MNRLIDANANRAAEGLRVLEDVARFILDAGDLSGRTKDLRHALRAAVPAAAVLSRDTAGDVGTDLDAADENARADLVGLVRANACRAAEALRVIEESAKLPWSLHPSTSGRGTAETTETTEGGAMEALRYRLYDLERDFLTRLPAWRLRGERLYVIVDPGLCADPTAVAVAAVAGGAGIIQLRAKGLAIRPYRDLAARVRDAVPAALFIVNDDTAVAVAVGADGVHLGQDDLPIVDARRVLGAGRLVGASVHRPEQLAVAQAAGADHVGLGPMHTTTTKAHEPVVGIGLLDAVRADLTVPSYAIGGIDTAWVAVHRARIVHGICVCGSVCRSDDPRGVCEQLGVLLAV